MRPFVSILAAASFTTALFVACSSDPNMAASQPDSGSRPSGGWGGSAAALAGTYIPEDAQRPGDPAKGYDYLVNGGYISCGIPWSVYSKVMADAPESQRVAGRTGRNEKLPYALTATTTKRGVEVVSENCLVCHAGHIDGKLMVGLGAADSDFTYDHTVEFASLAPLAVGEGPRAEYTKWFTRVSAIAPWSVTRTMGSNPADSFTATLFSHHDPVTLAWSDKALLPEPSKQVIPVDVPPWWRMSKKHAQFYNASGRGDHARIEMTAAMLCSDTLDEVREIDARFVDVRAFIESLPPPAYPYGIDTTLAATGRGVFEATCSRCHGTYGAQGAYPNLLIAIADVGTDPQLALGTGQFAGDDAYSAWYAKSFYGELARLEPKPGYVAPPLDGIWATAPFLHNGSVPTIEALLDTRKRPRYWSRAFTSDEAEYDKAALGWKFQSLDHEQDAELNPLVRKKIYDTTLFGQSNGGHAFGDVLSSDERAAVIEYLKTL